MMDPVIKGLWADALESGEFQQTCGCLHDAKGYCCLGVLCETVKRHTGTGKWEDLGDGTQRFVWNDELGGQAYDVLPVNMLKAVGLKPLIMNTSPIVEVGESGQYGGKQNLAVLNDSGKSFKEIARLIREQL